MRIDDIEKEDITGLDLNLLLVFDAVMRTGKVSHAAEELGVTQSTASSQLGKLREMLSDPLFVRTSHGVTSTPFSENLHPYIREAIETIRRGIDSAREFDPSTAERTFTIIMTDIGETTILPSIISGFSKFAPNITFRAINLPTHETPDALKSGLADLAIAYMPYLEVGFFQRNLFSTDYICLARKNHPLINSKMTRSNFKECDHVVAEARGTGHFYLLEQNFEALGIQRCIKVRVPNFMTIPHIVSGTDLIATVPRAFGRALKDGPPIKGYEHPIALPSIDVKLLWHERYHRDAAHSWLREQIAQEVQKINWEQGITSFMPHSAPKKNKIRSTEDQERRT